MGLAGRFQGEPAWTARPRQRGLAYREWESVGAKRASPVPTHWPAGGGTAVPAVLTVPAVPTAPTVLTEPELASPVPAHCSAHQVPCCATHHPDRRFREGYNHIFRRYGYVAVYLPRSQ